MTEPAVAQLAALPIVRHAVEGVVPPVQPTVSVPDGRT
jgi:hypothetical protein